MTRMERKLSYVIFADDGVFVARCLDVDVASDGPTEQEAVANLKEALELYFDGHSNSPIKAEALELCRQVDASGEPGIVTDQDQPLSQARRYKLLSPRSQLEVLRGSVPRYDDPLAPVGEGDWEVLR